jgi:tRNA(Ile2) C34 agmatinyltransferase TiaS
MKVRVPNGCNSTKCPRCGKLLSSQWFGYKCIKCNYEQLNKIGREFIENMNRMEIK